GDRPDAAREAEERPDVARIAVVAREEPAHDRVAGVEDEGGPHELAQPELGADERETAPVREERRERHGAFPRGGRSIYYDDRAREEERPILTKDRLQRLAEELLANPRLAQMFMSAVQAGLETKGHIDRNIQTVLGLLNVPSRADLNKL